MIYARNQGAESFALDNLAPGERQRAHRAAMECACEGDEFIPAGVIAGQLHGGLNRFRARVAEVDAPRDIAGRNRRELLAQLHHVFVVEIRAGHVDQLRGLLLDGLDHFRVAMAC